MRHDGAMSNPFDDEDSDQHLGLTYAGVIVRLPGSSTPADARAAVLAELSELRFSGWLGPAEPPWAVAVADNPAGSVAGGRTGIGALTAQLAAALGTVALGVQVVGDRTLRLTLASEGNVLGEYESDPTHGRPDDDEAWPEPTGVEIADPLVHVCQTGDVETLTEILAEELEPGSVFESERLTAVARHLGMPDWLVAADSLPRAVPGGPAAGEVTRLGAGTPGPLGWARGTVVGAVRKRRPPTTG